MAWTAILKELFEESAAWRVVIVYTDGRVDEVRKYSVAYVDDDVIRQLAHNEVTQLARKESAKGKVSIAPGETIDMSVAPTESRAPTAEELALSTFAEDYRLLMQKRRGEAAGLIASDAKDLLELAEKVKATYRPEYEEVL